MRSRAGCAARPQSLSKRTVGLEPTINGFADRRLIQLGYVRLVAWKFARAVCQAPQSYALAAAGSLARAMREEGVEPSVRVWKTRMLAVTSLPRKFERAVQESNPHPEPVEAARF